MQGQDCQIPKDVEAFAFAHLDALAGLLHGCGHRDMAALLDGMGDMHRLTRRRAAKSRGGELLGPRDGAVDYVLDQLDDLARLMEEHGLGDAAFLLRMPAKLQAAADRRRDGEDAETHVVQTARAPAESPDPAIGATARDAG